MSEFKIQIGTCLEIKIFMLIAFFFFLKIYWKLYSCISNITMIFDLLNLKLKFFFFTFCLGVVMSMALAVIPCACRLADSLYDNNSSSARAVDSKFLIEPYCPAKHFSTITTLLSYLATVSRTCFGSSLRLEVINSYQRLSGVTKRATGEAAIPFRKDIPPSTKLFLKLSISGASEGNCRTDCWKVFVKM